MPSPAKRRRRGTLQSAEQRPALLMGRGAGVESHQLLTLAKLGFSGCVVIMSNKYIIAAHILFAPPSHRPLLFPTITIFTITC